MKILAIDTSSKYLSLAIAEEEKVIAGFHRAMDQRQCEELIPQVDRLLRKTGLRLKDIGCIAFSKGPGALTALRIGAAAVKGLALPMKIKIVGVPTLDVLAWRICYGDTLPTAGCPRFSGGRLIVPVVDARRGNVYSSIYSFKNGRLRRHLKYSVIPIAELLKHIKGDAIFSGDGLVAYRKAIEENFRHKAEFAAEKFWYPRAAVAAHLGCELIKKRRFEEIDRFTPMYLYPRDVQVRKKVG